MRILILATVVVLGVAAARAGEPHVLWDQTDLAPEAAAGQPDAAAGCRPGTETVHQASDLSLSRAATVARITTYYAATAPGSFGTIAEAWLWIAPKKKGLPELRGGDPRRDGRLVGVSARPVGGHYELVADGLEIPLQAGEYWLSLTPVVPVGPAGGFSHLGCRRSWGEPPVAWRPCGGGGWRSGGNADLALRVEGFPVPLSAAGSDGALWRLPR